MSAASASARGTCSAAGAGLGSCCSCLFRSASSRASASSRSTKVKVSGVVVEPRLPSSRHAPLGCSLSIVAMCCRPTEESCSRSQRWR